MTGRMEREREDKLLSDEGRGLKAYLAGAVMQQLNLELARRVEHLVRFQSADTGGDTQPRYEALVVGTRFGGAVATCRLSQAGVRVGVLERGRRYPLGKFPRNWKDPLDGWFWSHQQGLDIKPFERMTVVEGAGHGGGSLVYAKVHLRARASAFAT